MEDIGNSHEKSHDQNPGGQSCIQPFLPNNISMQSMERLSWLSKILPAPGGPCWPCVSPPPELLSASQLELNAMMHGETGKLLELRRKLEKEMERISEDFISSHCGETESFLDQIRELRNKYQDEIKDFVENFTVVIEDPRVLHEWTQEVKNIGILVKRHSHRIRLKAFQLTSTSPQTYCAESSWLEYIPPPKRTNLPQASVSDDTGPALQNNHKSVSDVDPLQQVSGGQPDNKASSCVDLLHGREEHHGHNVSGAVDLHQDGAGREITSLGLYQDSGGLNAVWQDLCQAARWVYCHDSQVTETELDQGDLYQDSGGITSVLPCHDGETSICQNSTDHEALRYDVNQVRDVVHDYSSDFYQAGHGGGTYLAAKAALYLASVCKPEVASQAQAGHHDTHTASSQPAAPQQSLSQACCGEQDTTRQGEETEHSIVEGQEPDHVVPGHVVQGHVLPGYAGGTPSKSEAVVIFPAESTEQRPCKNGVVRATCMRNRFTKGRVHSRKELVRAALVMLAWIKFLARQRLLLHYLAIAYHICFGCSVTAIVEDISHGRCLNDTMRAMSAKLRAACMLSSVGLVSTSQFYSCVVNLKRMSMAWLRSTSGEWLFLRC